MIENPFNSHKFHGDYDLVISRRLDLEEGGTSAAARTETNGGKQERR